MRPSFCSRSGPAVADDCCMKGPLAWLSCVVLAGCASVSPSEQADLVRAMPGRKPLRVGLVVVGSDRTLQEAFPAPAAAPGGAAPVVAVGDVYGERTVLPESLAEDDVLDAVIGLGAFTDVVALPFDVRGVRSREALVQRVQDRLWPTAIAQELDALLVVEGIADGGLRWSDADEGFFSLDTVLWWLCWPFGAWIPDRAYAPDAAIRAEILWIGDQGSTPRSLDVGATAGTQSLAPWERAAVPFLGFVVPPVWLADDRATVAATIGGWARQMLPVELVRRLKQEPMAGPGAVDLRAVVRGDQVVLSIDSAQEVTDAVVVALPRGALTTPAEALPVTLQSRIETGASGPRHRASGQVELALVRQSAQALLRVRITLASGEQVSRTWSWADLQD